MQANTLIGEVGIIVSSMAKNIGGTVQWSLPVAQTIAPQELAVTLLRQRGFAEQVLDTFLHPRYQSLGDPFGLPDMQAAVDHIVGLHDQDVRLAIYGDYDIDGMTASALLYDVLQRAGYQVEVYIPDRFEEGYGLNKQALEKLAKRQIHTVITVDCGSTAATEVAFAVEQGLQIIVTDHHTLGTEPLTGAVAHINPLRETNTYPEPRLAGVGVAFGLARGLQQVLPDFLPAGQEKWLLDLVALGTICDVVPLTGENRTLARFGLEVLRKTRRPGLQALAEVAGVELSELKGDDVGFRFGPRLNAAGRLEHAQAALQLILATERSQEVQELANNLQALNVRRQEQTATVLAAARMQATDQSEEACLVVADPDWSHGVAGLVAARLAEEFHKPTFVLQIEGETSKGSGRSVGDFRLIDALQATQQYLKKFGGHAAAAGVTLATQDIADFRQALHDYVVGKRLQTQFNTTLKVDMWLQPEFLEREILDQIHLLEPCGNDNPAPVFSFEGKVAGLRRVGAEGQHYQLTVEGSAGHFRTIAFGAAERWPWLEVGSSLQALVRLNSSVWQGVTRVEAIVADIREP